MNGQSPLLKKAIETNKKKRFEIPKKGRIRIFLLIVIASIAIFDVISKGKNDTKQPAKKVKEKVNLKKKVDSREKKIRKKEKKIISKKSLTRENVKYILINNNITFDSPDYIIGSNKRKIRLYTSVDTKLQTAGKKLMRKYHPLYGSIVAMNPLTGRVLALISFTKEGVANIGNRIYSLSEFPAASVFKTVTAVAAMEYANLKPTDKIKTVGANHTLYKRQLTKEKSNFTLVTLRDAYAYSINPAFGRIALHTLGAAEIEKAAIKMGFNSSIPFDLDVGIPKFKYPDSTFEIAELASGFNQSTEISPLFGAMMAATVCNNGKMCAPYVVDSITDNDGRKIYSFERKILRQTMSENTAKYLKNIMSAVTRYGTARKSFKYIKSSFRFKDITYGGKTGSIDKDGIGKIDWFVGFSSHKTDPAQQIAVAVLTVHNENWTVHSSFIAEEIMRKFIRNYQIARSADRKDTTLSEGEDING